MVLIRLKTWLSMLMSPPSKMLLRILATARRYVNALQPHTFREYDLMSPEARFYFHGQAKTSKSGSFHFSPNRSAVIYASFDMQATHVADG